MIKETILKERQEWMYAAYSLMEATGEHLPPGESAEFIQGRGVAQIEKLKERLTETQNALCHERTIREQLNELADAHNCSSVTEMAAKLSKAENRLDYLLGQCWVSNFEGSIHGVVELDAAMTAYEASCK